MKSFSKKLSALFMGLTILTIGSFSAIPAFADSPGQLATGPSTYEVKNVTQKGSYASTITANACDVVEYSLMLANTNYNPVYNVIVTATLPSASSTSNTSNATAVPDSGATYGTTGSATVNFSSAQTLSYTNGTTELFDSKGNVIEKLADTVNTTGVNVGTIQGSTTEYLNFEAQVGCVTPQVPTYSCNVLNLTQSGNTVTASVNTTATNGATLTNVSYNFGNGSAPIVSSNSTVSYTYPAVSANTNYTVTATPNFNVNGTSKTASSANCAKTVSLVVPTTPVTPVTPVTPTPTALVNTGPGDVVGIFAATTIVGAVAHRLFKNRQLARSNR